MSLFNVIYGFTWLVMGVLVIFTTVLLLVPVLRQNRDLLYRRGVLYYALSILSYTASWIFTFLMIWRILSQSQMMILMHIAFLLGGVLHLAAAWEFAQSFLSFRQTLSFSEPADSEGGFEDAD